MVYRQDVSDDGRGPLDGTHLEVSEEQGEVMVGDPADDHQQRHNERGNLLTGNPPLASSWDAKVETENQKQLTIELPTQMVIVSSILPFIAIHTDVMCSAAFAWFDLSIRDGLHRSHENRRTTMGRRTRPMKGFGTL